MNDDEMFAGLALDLNDVESSLNHERDVLLKSLLLMTVHEYMGLLELREGEGDELASRVLFGLRLSLGELVEDAQANGPADDDIRGIEQSNKERLWLLTH